MIRTISLVVAALVIGALAGRFLTPAPTPAALVEIDGTLPASAGATATQIPIDVSDASSLERALQDVIALPNSPARDQEIADLLSLIGRKDPNEAVRLAVEARAEPILVASALARLALGDPDAALAWLSELEEPLAQREAAVSIARALGGDASALRRVLDALPESLSANVVRTDVYAQLGVLSPDLALEMALSEGDSADRWDALERVAASWGMRAPREALARMERIADPGLAQRYENIVMRVWARADPIGALGWLSERRSNGHDVVQSQETDALRWAVRANPGAALDYARTRDQVDGKQSQLRSFVYMAWVGRDASAALAELATESDIDASGYYLSQVLTIAARDAPEDAIAWALSQSEGREAAITAVITGLQDVDRAIDLATTLETPSARQTALARLAMNATDVGYFADRVLAMSEEPPEFVLGQALASWSDRDPAAALDWWSEHPQIMDYSWLQVAASDFYGEDAGRTINVISSMPSESGEFVLNALVSSLVMEDSTAAVDALDRAAGLPGHEIAVASVASHIAYSDPDAALRLAERHGVLNGDSDAGARIASTWANSGPEAAIAWAESLSTVGARTRATRAAFTSWSQHDPQGAADWARAQPAGAVRDQRFATLYVMQSLQGSTSSSCLDEIEDNAYRARVEAELRRFDIEGAAGPIVAGVLTAMR